MNGADKILSIARKELGITESPAGSNQTKYGKWYGLDGQPWCMMFVMWVLHQAGVKIPYKTASCSDFLRWYQANRPACVVKVPWPGDIVLYTFGHTGFVETAGPGTITAIEGNTSPDSSGSQANGGMVCRKVRKQSLVKAYIRPEYELEEEMMDISKLTDAEVLQLARRIAEGPCGTAGQQRTGVGTGAGESGRHHQRRRPERVRDPYPDRGHGLPGNERHEASVNKERHPLPVKVKGVFWFEREPFPRQSGVRIRAQWWT